jgi:hypothetical protein
VPLAGNTPEHAAKNEIKRRGREALRRRRTLRGWALGSSDDTTAWTPALITG